MRDLRIGQYSPLSGIGAAILLVVAAAFVGLGSYLATPEDLLASLAEDPSRASAGAYLGELSMFFMVLFAGSVHASVSASEGRRGRASAIAFGGGIVAALAIGLAFVASSAMSDRAGTTAGIAAADAVALYDLRSALIGEALPIGLGIMVGATGVAALMTRLFPAWFGWVSLAVAAVCLSPIGFLGLIGGVTWIVVIGIWLSIRTPGNLTGGQ